MTNENNRQKLLLLKMNVLDNNILILWSFIFFTFLHLVSYLYILINRIEKRNSNYLNWFDKRRLYYSFGLSTLHAIVVGPLATYIWYSLDKNICIAPNIGTSSEINDVPFYLCDFMIGYLLADFVLISIWLSPKETNLHHIIGIIGLGLITFTKGGGKLGLFFVATEISTIFLNIRWFMLQNNKQEKNDQPQSTSRAMTIINILFVISFGAVRIVGIPWLLECCIQLYNSNLLKIYSCSGIIAASIITSLNIYWFCMMIIKIIVILRPGTFDNVEYYTQIDKEEKRE